MPGKVDRKVVAIYPGTFDPITNGHIDIIKRGVNIFDKVVVAIGHNPKKQHMFTLEERKDMIRHSIPDIKNIEIDTFNGLLVDYAKKKGAAAIIRGLRAVSDFEYEFQMTLMNRTLDVTIETVFFMPSEEFVYLTSSIIKEVSRYIDNKENLIKFVTPYVLQKLKERLKNETQSC